MEALSNIYEKPSAAHKVFLIRELVNTRMKEDSSVTEHINKMNSILARLTSVGIKFDDEVQALLLTVDPKRLQQLLVLRDPMDSILRIFMISWRGRPKKEFWGII